MTGLDLKLFLALVAAFFSYQWAWWAPFLAYPAVILLFPNLGSLIESDPFELGVRKFLAYFSSFAYTVAQAVIFHAYLGSWYGWILGAVLALLMAGLTIGRLEVYFHHMDVSALSSELTDALVLPDELGVLWLRFWYSVRLPSGLVVSLIAIDNAESEGVFTNLLVVYPLIAVFIAIGLMNRRLWAWKANYLILVMDCIYVTFSTVGKGPQGANIDELWKVGVVILIFSIWMVCWFLPNHIYFKKRRSLFS